MLSLRALYTLTLLLPAMAMAMAISGCRYIGINDASSFFIGRYTQYMRGNIPDQYADATNPLPASTMNISNGKRLYQTHCPACHGASGGGDGPAGKQLVPQPANLAFSRRLPVTTDAFLFWTLSEGGKPFGSAMPAFGDQLSNNEIWQIIHYINTGFAPNQGISI